MFAKFNAMKQTYITENRNIKTLKVILRTEQLTMLPERKIPPPKNALSKFVMGRNDDYDYLYTIPSAHTISN